MSKIKALLVVAILVGFFGSAFAVSFPGDRAGWKSDYLFKKLKLTNEQYMKIYPAYLNYEMKVDDLKAKKMDKKGLADEMTKLQAGVNAEVEKVFTKDQAEKWGKMKGNFYKMTPKKRVKKVEGTEEVKKDEKKDVKKEEPKKEVKKEEKKKDVKKEEPKKDVKKEEPKKEEKKK